MEFTFGAPHSAVGFNKPASQCSPFVKDHKENDRFVERSCDRLNKESSTLRRLETTSLFQAIILSQLHQLNIETLLFAVSSPTMYLRLLPACSDQIG